MRIPTFTNFFQFHQKPDEGKPWGPPPFQIRLYPDKRIELVIHTGPKSKVVKLGHYKPKEWNDFAMQVKFAEDKSGFIRLWVNNREYSHSGRPFAFKASERGQSAPYVKMGSYTGKRRPNDKIVLYVDSFRMANNSAKLEDVYP
ncbi:MAG: heparin lyase I family protein [Myxococcota bacterium]